MLKRLSQLMSTRYGEIYMEVSTSFKLITLIIWGVEMSEYVSCPCLVVFSTITFLPYFVLHKKGSS